MVPHNKVKKNKYKLRNMKLLANKLSYEIYEGDLFGHRFGDSLPHL